MDGIDPELLRWGVTAAIAVAAAAVVAIIAVVVARRVAQSPARHAAAASARTKAGNALVRLDDAVAELELEAALSGSLTRTGSPADLRRARMGAQHARDDAFRAYAGLDEAALTPREVHRRADGIAASVEAALADVIRARATHAAWVREHVATADQIAAARVRLAELRAGMGDPAGLVRELSARFDETEWTDAASAAREALAAAADAQRRLDAAATAANALPDLAAAERALRRAQADERTLEETHRLVTQAAAALPGEFDAARSAIRQAAAARDRSAGASADRIDAETREFAAMLDALRRDAPRRPTEAVELIVRRRQRLDLALGSAATHQQRVRGARTALPGTLAAARGAIARAEASVSHARASADARVRLASATDALAEARTAPDPLSALAAARRALDAAAGVLADTGHGAASGHPGD